MERATATALLLRQVRAPVQKMSTTAGSPNPARAALSGSTPVAQSESATPIATTATGSLSMTKTTTTAPRTRNVIVVWLTAYVCTGEPGPSGIPSRYQATKKIVQRTVRTRA